ncbi:MAG: hypothetical protein CO189_04530 [candidate division Zixibacteria bacterium CG_4_9_14_3_um_filter_46_8]|nr:MAG: hypothetical protein CO189_04530 [candidate division Zixibacteria bacterium CG_4_9_14_3_um_filter_46_8]
MFCSPAEGFKWLTFGGTKDDFDAFLAALYPSEYKQKYNSTQLSRLYDDNGYHQLSTPAMNWKGK